MNSDFPGTEQLVLCEDRDAGLRAVIAIDDTTLGPAVGGIRLKAYPSSGAAIEEARRLAAAMTLKNALAELPFGGGKAVILQDGPIRDRTTLMLAFGEFVARLGGTYVPGADMGTTVDDLAIVGQIAPDVACDEEDPAPWTSLGVWSGIRAAVAHVHGSATLAGTTVAIQGTGNVGADLARRVAADGGHVIVADIDEARAARVAAEVGGRVVAADAIASTPADVFAPCAAARVINEATLERLGSPIVAGAANDVLADTALADALHARGVLYVPDFLLNAGGVVHIHALRAGWSRDQLDAAVRRIGDRTAAILAAARSARGTPLAHATGRAQAVLATARSGQRDVAGTARV